MSPKMREKILKTIFFFYVILMLYFSVAGPGATATSGSDKFDHAGAFLLFALLLRSSFKSVRPVFVFLWGFSYGILIEVIQHFLPYRTADPADVIADTIGLAAGILIILFFFRTGSEKE